MKGIVENAIICPGKWTIENLEFNFTCQEQLTSKRGKLKVIGETVSKFVWESVAREKFSNELLNVICKGGIGNKISSEFLQRGEIWLKTHGKTNMIDFLREKKIQIEHFNEIFDQELGIFTLCVSTNDRMLSFCWILTRRTLVIGELHI